MQITSKLYNYRRRFGRWFLLRCRLIEKSDFCCTKCKKNFPYGKYLTVHHKYYIEDRDPWDYPDDAFDVLCLKCHGLIDNSNIPRKKNAFKIELSSKKFIITNRISFKKYYETFDVPYNEFFGIVYYGSIINCGYTTKYDFGNGRFDYELIVRELNNKDNSYTQFRKKFPDNKEPPRYRGIRTCLRIENYI